MNKRIRFLMTFVIIAISIIAWNPGLSWAKDAQQKNKELKYRGGKLTTAERKAAALRAKNLGLRPGKSADAPIVVPKAGTKSRGLSALAAPGITALAAPLPGIEGPGGVPHYFGPYANWAFSPLPKGPITSITLGESGEGYNNPIAVVEDVYGTGSGAAPIVVTKGAAGEITGISGGLGGTNYSAPTVTIVDDPALCGGLGQPDCGTGATATASISTIPAGGRLTGGLRKFVDKMPGLGEANANNLGQYIPVGVKDTTRYPGSDYYEIALVEYYEQLHSDLPGPLNPNTPGALGTKLRGYVQIEPPGSTTIPTGSKHILLSGVTYKGLPVYGYDKPHYLGPVLVAKGRVHGIENVSEAGKPTPVRVKFYNLLPAGAGGNLFIPVDESIPGAGFGPTGSKYTQNRAAVHLHGNNTVWISDGNVHQWLTPANENTPYPKGVSTRNVPDMGNECDAANSGCMTFFYTNAQSARLQFYHDHAIAITRLNVYAGEAGGYVVTDAVEQDMINGTNVTGVNPGLKKVLPDLGIPLIIQDKTFVEAATVFAQDPTWNWGTGPRNVNGNITAAVDGDLWYPHVYMTVQNPWDLTGTNAFGRWHYGPWFNPPTPTCVNGLPVGCIEVGPVPNEYYQPVCDGLPDPVNTVCTAPWEPPMRPGNPNPSLPGESFFDTQLVNGTAYPYLEIEPKAYRFRVLNASNDRFLNLQLYVAADKTTPTTPNTTGTRICNGTSGAAVTDCTEVKMVPVYVAPANQFADTPSGIPDPATKGPSWIQIGTEGGFMPKPVVIPQQPIGYNLDPAYFSFGLVNQHSLYLGSAERADVVVDFSAYAGRTLILYNDSPAPVPAGASPYDFYTGNGDQMDGGGAPNTQPGYGPNTRTIMQIRVTKPLTTPTTDVTLTNLQTVFAKTASKRGVFEVSQDPIIVPQAAYNTAYNNVFPNTATGQYIQIANTAKTFRPINENGVLQPQVTIPLQLKAMHDEMGGVYDTMFGRMSGMLGLSLQNSPNHVLVPYGLASPPTDLVAGSIEGTPIGIMPDGTQIWRLFHNGVDTHTIHTHLFHTQLINRVDQSGQVTGGTLPVDPTDLGWKDTFKINPLEITYLAMRPTVPTPSQVPFEVPNSVRLIDPTLPVGATLVAPAPAGWFDPVGNFIPEITNHFVNFGWEYVWHCHILSHEEMDMMHSLVFAVPPNAPSNLTVAVNGTSAVLRWSDNSTTETGFTIQRATDNTFTAGLTSFTIGGNNTATATYTDTISLGTTYYYRVFANNLVGDTASYPASPAGFPKMSADSGFSNVASTGAIVTPPAAPSLLTATLLAGPQVRLSWQDNATNETGFVVERCTGTSCTNFVQIAAPGPFTGTGTVTYLDTTVVGPNTYRYRVRAVNAAGPSAYSNIVSISVPSSALPAAPSNFTATAVRGATTYTVTFRWVDNATNETGFTVQRATNSTFTNGLASLSFGANVTSFTFSQSPNTTYYYRIRSRNAAGVSAWVNAVPFPLTTGN